MTLTSNELALRGLLEHTSIPPEVAVRIARNAGLSPARTARLLHSLLDLSVDTLKAMIRRVFDELEAEQTMQFVQQVAELDGLDLKEPISESTWKAIMLTNFSVTDSINVAQHGRAYDLHNCADFQGFSYDVTESRLSLRWVIVEFGSSGQHLEICFENVDYLTVHHRDSEMPVSEDLTLDHIGSVSHGIIDQMTFFKGPVYQVDAGEALLFQFRGGQAVVVHAKLAILKVTHLA
ncbi:hypothetical protein [Deinococcus alpinitundrae]|uniref:hypothetical protein n=1 Tax=Deinococcus alpinitundrae TaxID=468913 RepID=UPI00137A330F|nr:hypothetical protein [Deinococcus alpinitundrae]